MKLEQTDIQYNSMSLWVDAISINQNDEQEKSSQVQMMWDIYRSAATLVVWLGELDNEDENESMRVFCARPSVLGYWRERTHTAIQLLSKRSWFVRRWACQEVSATLSKYESEIVLIGEHTLRLRALTNGLKKTKRDRLDRLGVCSAHKNARMGLLQRLHCHHDIKCQNDLDRIYALMHMCHDIERFNVRVDYSKTPEDPYSDIAKTIVQDESNHQEKLTLLVLATAHPPPLSTDLPSWIPDWRAPLNLSCDEHSKLIDDQLWLLGKAATEPAPNEIYKLALWQGRYLRVQGELCPWGSKSLSNANTFRHLFDPKHERPGHWHFLTPAGSEEICSLLERLNDGSHFASRFHQQSPTFVIEKVSEASEGPDLSVYRLMFCFNCKWREPLERSAVSAEIFIA